MRYILPGVQLETDFPLHSFTSFLSDVPADLPLVHLQICNGIYKPQNVLYSAKHHGVNVDILEDGWVFLRSGHPQYALHATSNYRQMTAYIPEAPDQDMLTPLIRTALECASITQCVISLHSACVALDEKAVCFSAPSGIGKSTRAKSWETALGAQMLSGDRPALRISADSVTACGVPWDGKEQIFRNVHAPLLAVCYIYRGSFVRVRRLSANQARRFLTQQCFLPMWDTDAAYTVMRLIDKLCKSVPIYKLICGPGETDAHKVKEILYHRHDEIVEVEQDMKIKNGFALRSTAGEHIVMPTGKNISSFDGAIVLNDVAAFVWEKLTTGASREELLEYILSEFEVSRELAARDLDALIDKLRGYGVIEDESI